MMKGACSTFLPKSRCGNQTELSFFFSQNLLIIKEGTNMREVFRKPGIHHASSPLKGSFRSECTFLLGTNSILNIWFSDNYAALKLTK